MQYEKRYNYKLLKRCVFKAFLKALTDEDCLTVSGKSFQSFEADTVKALSHRAWRLVGD